MIALIRLAVIVGLLWSGWWLAAGFGLRQGLAAWFDARAARGWQAEFSEISTTGYPLRHVTRLNTPALADPATGLAWRAEWLDLDNPALWPGRQTLRFAPAPMRLSYFDQTAEIRAENPSADLHLEPGLALEVERMAVTAGAWRISAETGALMAGDALTLKMVRREAPHSYHVDLDVARLTPGDRLRRLLRSAEGLPASFDSVTLDMAVEFDRSWDRRALEQRRPQPVAIDLHLAELSWGPLLLRAAGMVSVDAAGIPQGTVTVRAENWREILTMVRASGLVPGAAADALGDVLGLLSELGGNSNALDAELTLRDGIVAYGLLPLGPAPRLILR